MATGFWLKLLPVDPATGLTVEFLFTSLNMRNATTIEAGKTWYPYLSSKPKTEISVFEGEFTGQSAVAISDLEISAENALVATFPSYVWDGCAAKVYKGTELTTSFASLTSIFDGVVNGSPEISGGVAKIQLVDHNYRIDKPIPLSKYTGGGGIEGPSDLEGTYKPYIIGSPIGVEPILINSAFVVFQYAHAATDTDFSALAGLYESGISFDAATSTVPWQGTAAATYTALTAVSLTLGQWADAPSIGCFRLGGEPKSGGVITCDPVRSGSFTITSVITELLTKIGVTGATDAGNLSTFLSACYNQTISDVIVDEPTAMERISAYLSYVGGYSFWNQTGGFRLGLIRYTSPISIINTSPPFTTNAVADYDSLPVSAPHKRIRLGGDKCFRVHNTSEISDALLWAQITGDGKPVDGATKNTVTAGAGTPSGGTDGDLYYQINVSWWTKITGIWSKVSDITAVNTAAAIAGQGALATQNSADFATQVGGAAKPADNATKNTVTTGAGAPSGGTDGDLYYQTGVSWWSKLAGVWVKVSDITAANTAAAIAGQGALATLNSADFSTQVGGAAKPADNATKNVVTTGAGVPSGGTDGDLYYQTGVSWWSKMSGVWAKVSDITAVNTAAAIAGQGSLATLNTVSKTEIDANAVTAPYFVETGFQSMSNGTSLQTITGLSWSANVPVGEGIDIDLNFMPMWSGTDGTRFSLDAYLLIDGTIVKTFGRVMDSNDMATNNQGGFALPVGVFTRIDGNGTSSTYSIQIQLKASRSESNSGGSKTYAAPDNFDINQAALRGRRFSR